MAAIHGLAVAVAATVAAADFSPRLTLTGSPNEMVISWGRLLNSSAWVEAPPTISRVRWGLSKAALSNEATSNATLMHSRTEDLSRYDYCGGKETHRLNMVHLAGLPEDSDVYFTVEECAATCATSSVRHFKTAKAPSADATLHFLAMGDVGDPITKSYTSFPEMEKLCAAHDDIALGVHVGDISYNLDIPPIGDNYLDGTFFGVLQTPPDGRVGVRQVRHGRDLVHVGPARPPDAHGGRRMELGVEEQRRRRQGLPRGLVRGHNVGAAGSAGQQLSETMAALAIDTRPILSSMSKAPLPGSRSNRCFCDLGQPAKTMSSLLALPMSETYTNAAPSHGPSGIYAWRSATYALVGADGAEIASCRCDVLHASGDIVAKRLAYAGGPSLTAAVAAAVV